MIVRVELSTMSTMSDCIVISGEDVCCRVVLGTLVGVFLFSVMWSELLMILVILCGHQCMSAIKWSVRLHLL